MTMLQGKGDNSANGKLPRKSEICLHFIPIIKLRRDQGLHRLSINLLVKTTAAISPSHVTGYEARPLCCTRRVMENGVKKKQCWKPLVGVQYQPSAPNKLIIRPGCTSQLSPLQSCRRARASNAVNVYTSEAYAERKHRYGLTSSR